MCRKERRGAVTLPLDLHEEILHRLRSNDLLHFKRVCRDWERLISSPGFIEKHLERSKAECYEPRVLVPSAYDAEILDCADIESSKTIPWCLEASLLGSCDGLVLYYDSYEEKIGALNLSTGKCEVRKPNPSMEDDITEKLICSWFGHHPSTGEYVLVFANLYESEAETNKPKRVEFNVHALSRNDTDSSLLSSSTRELDWGVYQHIANVSSENYQAQKLGWPKFYHNVGTLLQGRLHCPVSLRSSISDEIEILVYDFETNNITQMSSPLKYCHALGVANGYLCAVEWHRVRVMMEYGVKESWTKCPNIKGNIIFHAAFCPNGDVIAIDHYDTATMFIIRAMDTVLLKAFDSYTNRESVACIDSLVSPASVWNKKE